MIDEGTSSLSQCLLQATLSRSTHCGGIPSVAAFHPPDIKFNGHATPTIARSFLSSSVAFWNAEDLWETRYISQSYSLFILAISSLNVYGIILGGWASNSKYAFLGALRSASQMISYEVSIGLTILPVIILTGSFNLTDIILMQNQTIWFIFPLFPCFIIFFISMLAETNRAPFDLPEAEAELVAGYNVEYGSMGFTLYFLGEYGSMLLMSTLITLLFCGGWLFPFFGSFIFFNFFAPIIFSIKIAFFCFCYVLVRAAFPRYRYDQLMDIGWKIFLPFTLSFLIFISSFSLAFNILPISLF